MQISILGDSISKGVVFDGLTRGYSQLKENYVSILRDKFNFAINNYSKFGCTVSKGLAMLDFHKDKVADSQYAVIEFGGNDSDFNWQEVSDAPAEMHLPFTEKNEFREKYEKIIDELEEIGVTPVLMNLPPVDAVKYFQRVSNGKNADNILKFLNGDVQYIYRWHESYNLEISKISYSKRVPLIDIRTAFLLDKNSRELICEDGIHPSVLGHRMIAKSIEEYLQIA